MLKNNFGYKNKKDFSLLILCWIIYSSTYICRLNFSAVIPELTSNSVFSESKIAAVSSAFFIFYGVGQLFSGIIGDKINTRYMIFFGSLTSAVCNIVIFFFHSYPVLLIMWALNGAVQSFVWSPILKLASVEYDEESRDKFGLDMATTVPVGTIMSYAVSLITLLFLPWKYVFLTCGLLSFLASAVWITGTQKFHLKKPSPAVNKNENQNSFSLKGFITLLASSGVLILLIPIMIQGTLKDSVTQWVPDFFTKQFSSSTVFSLALTMLLPVINVTGSYFAKAVNKRFKNEIKTSLLFFIISVLFLILLITLGRRSVAVALIAMAGVTNCMFAVNVMLITIVPLHFSKSGIVSTVAGFLNAVAYIGCGAANLVAGKILDGGNWENLFIFWIGIALIAIITSCFSLKQWQKYR